MFIICLTANPLFNIGYYGYFKLNLDAIIEKYCINKGRPELQCNGQCHLMKTLSLSKSTSKNEPTRNLSILDTFRVVFFQKYTFEWTTIYNLKSLVAYAFANVEYQQPLLHIALPPPRI